MMNRRAEFPPDREASSQGWRIIAAIASRRNRGYTPVMSRAILVAAAISFGGAASAVAAEEAVAEFPRCVMSAPEGLREPATLRGLFLCQEAARRTFLQGYAAGAGREAPPEVLVRLEAFQRAEMRGYAARHPEEERPAKAAAKPVAAPQRPVAKEVGDGLADLAARLKELGGDGSRGITPEMAELIAQELSARQGGMTSDMRALLEAVKKDGATLTPETMGRLKGAAQDAKAEGLDLGVPAEIENLLLAPPAANEAPPGPPVD